jgi:cell division GTPase FtsZ
MDETDFKNYVQTNELQFKNIADSMEKMNSLLAKIDERQQKHYVDFISLGKDVEYLQKENIETKIYFNKKIKHIWDEVRENAANDKADKKEIEDSLKERDKKVWAIFSMAIIIGIPLVQWISGIISS